MDGDKISYVGPAREDMPAFERQTDLKGDLLMPGFKNAHTHSGMTFLRSAADDLPLHEWLEKQVFPNEAKLTAESLTAFVKVTCTSSRTSLCRWQRTGASGPSCARA